MSVRIDHVSLPASDAEAEARFLAGILGLDGVAPAGPDGDMFSVALAEGEVLFAEARRVTGGHLAFRVTLAELQVVVDRLDARGVAYGNDPAAPDNGLVTDPLGSEGRVYFTSPDGHLFEVTVHA